MLFGHHYISYFTLDTVLTLNTDLELPLVDELCKYHFAIALYIDRD